PLFLELDLNVLKVRTEFLLVLHQVLGFDVELVDFGIETRDRLSECVGLVQEPLGLDIAFDIAGFRERFANLFLMRLALHVDLAYSLLGITQRVGLAVESLVPVASITAAILEQVFAAVEHIGSGNYAVPIMTLVASGLSVFLRIQRP